MPQRSWVPARSQRTCFQPAEFTLRLDEPRPRLGRQEYLYKATTSYGVQVDVPQLTLAAQDTHGVVRFVLDNSTAVRGRERNITIDVTAYMDDWNTFRTDMVVCRGSPWAYATNVATEIYSRVSLVLM